MSIGARLVCGVGLLLVACATPPVDAQAPPDPPGQIGPLYVTLLGNYVGKQLRIAVDGQVLVDQRLTFAPMGAEHRYTAGTGLARRVAAEVEIEGCGEPWTGEVSLEPSATANLLIQGCQVEALAPA